MLILILLLHRGFENSVDHVDDSVVDIKCSNLVDATIEKSFDGSQDNESSKCFKCPLEKVILSLGNSFIPLAKSVYKDLLDFSKHRSNVIAL